MQKMTNHRHLRIPVVLLLCLGVSMAALAQPMEKPVAPLPSPIKAVANDISRVSFDVRVLANSDSSKLVLTVDNPDRKKVRVSVQGPQGYWDLFSEDVKLGAFRKIFDFSLAEDGIYTITVADGRRKFTKQVNINTTTWEVTHKVEIMDEME